MPGCSASAADAATANCATISRWCPTATRPTIYRWLDGEPAAHASIADLFRIAIDLAGFLNVLYRIDPSGGPAPGIHSFWRGGPLAVYDEETRRAIAALPFDAGTWERGRAWTLWKALIVAAGMADTNARVAVRALEIADAVLADHRRVS